tara:strand:- start:1148 stop:1276 length:129 start_codon:yes stop_codon:yes gene_type:complete
MIDKIVKDLGDETRPPQHPEEMLEDAIKKLNEIIDWINSQNG